MAGRRLRGVPSSRVVKAFEKAGYVVDRIAGSHYILVKAGSPTLSIPRHGTMKTGLLLSKIKAAGLTYDEFEELV